MKRFFAGLVLVACCGPRPGRAQASDSECIDTPPEHQLDQDGKVLPQYREWKQCMPAPPQRRQSTGMVTARALAHKPTKAARREFDRGVRAWREGQGDEAVRHLKEAVRLDPKFVESEAELGALYSKTNRLTLALTSLERALAMDPNWAVLHSNKAATLLQLNRIAEAEEAARQAVKLDPTSVEGHYVLGAAMFAQQKFTPEAATHLILAAGKYPKASDFLLEMQMHTAAQEPKGQP
jgi:tetratricopeptide (TPR) repeat protein